MYIYTSTIYLPNKIIYIQQWWKNRLCVSVPIFLMHIYTSEGIGTLSVFYYAKKTPKSYKILKKNDKQNGWFLYKYLLQSHSY